MDVADMQYLRYANICRSNNMYYIYICYIYTIHVHFGKWCASVCLHQWSYLGEFFGASPARIILRSVQDFRVVSIGTSQTGISNCQRSKMILSASQTSHGKCDHTCYPEKRGMVEGEKLINIMRHIQKLPHVQHTQFWSSKNRGIWWYMAYHTNKNLTRESPWDGMTRWPSAGHVAEYSDIGQNSLNSQPINLSGRSLIISLCYITHRPRGLPKPKNTSYTTLSNMFWNKEQYKKKVTKFWKRFRA